MDFEKNCKIQHYNKIVIGGIMHIQNMSINITHLLIGKLYNIHRPSYIRNI